MSRSNPLIIALVLILLAAGGYIFYHESNATTALQTTPGPATSAEQSFVTLVGELSPVNFNTGVLTDPRFTSLVDIRTAIVPEPVGSRDPFADPAGDSAPSGTGPTS